MKYLVTGAAGFIGAKVCYELLKQGHSVIGLDSLNDYYDINLKKSRLKLTNTLDNFNFTQLDISCEKSMSTLFHDNKFDRVIHLAAQAGVRYSLENPHAYANSNLVGFLNILECCRNHNIEHLVYASSSSVYGLNKKTPFSASDSVDHPVSLYAATKKSNELMAHSYSHLYNIPTTGLRFFTVYGPWGRPDMAPFIFTRKIINGETIDINNNGDMWRDFTYIDDIVEGVIRISDLIPKRNDSWIVESGSPATSSAPYRIYNIGHGTPINLMDFIKTLEDELGIEAKKNFRDMQPGDVYKTFADTQDLFDITGYKPVVGIKEGIANLVKWYREYYKI
ncbi:NAD-dependent epimerase [Providencia stuartii]|nr:MULTISPECIES: NAD-dependent epimerase [Providencia]MDE8748074.1 NAD-dependent epimerase [Providencia thailandensis]MDE8767371.1 NAD-dependent epimerase [Providencia thailandensis]MDE8779715.1 NAD-dependent epimerase [Providencia thailandensis]MDE8784106.1 NAD-dependent epimerase [Providencia thailandensis]MDE8787801.1 NAD-dependent epimerase [Providencia thailandensis]